MKAVLIVLASALFIAPASAGAQVKLSVRSHMDSHALRHPSHSYAERLTRDPAYREWKSSQTARLSSYSYRPVLRFAECMARFDKKAALRVLNAPLRSNESSHALVRAASTNHGCVVEHSAVHPLLLRAALAETSLKRGAPLAASVGKPVGVPAVVDGYPLKRIAECQVRRSPQLVRALLTTEPGDPSERQAAEALFADASSCGARQLGRLAPTAARLALVEAEYLRRFEDDR